MPCAAPPELGERQLIEALEGASSPQVDDHLAQCPYCRARADEFARLYAGLRAHLYRLDCPPSAELSELRLGLLPADRQTALEAHLGGCPHCRREAEQLERYLDGLAAELELSLAERVNVLVARLVRGGGGPILGLAPAGVRGDGDGALIYEAGATQLALEILPAAGNPSHSELLGLVSGSTTTGLLISLLRDGQQIATAEVDPIGNFVLADLAPGIYALTLRGPGLEVQVPDLRVP